MTIVALFALCLGPPLAVLLAALFRADRVAAPPPALLLAEAQGRLLVERYERLRAQAWLSISGGGQ